MGDFGRILCLAFRALWVWRSANYNKIHVDRVRLAARLAVLGGFFAFRFVHGGFGDLQSYSPKSMPKPIKNGAQIDGKSIRMRPGALRAASGAPVGSRNADWELPGKF